MPATIPIRLTLFVRNTGGLAAKLQARTREQFAAIRRASQRDFDRTFARCQESCPRDTHYMAEHMVGELTREGYNWLIGFRRRDFVGQTNPATGRVITAPYYKFVLDGTSRRPGNNFLRRDFQTEAANRAAGYRRALAVRGTGL